MDKEHKQKQKSQPQPAMAEPSTKLTQEALASFRNFERRMYSEYQQMQTHVWEAKTKNEQKTISSAK
jgi:hypothetical protein